MENQVFKNSTNPGMQASAMTNNTVERKGSGAGRNILLVILILLALGVLGWVALGGLGKGKLNFDFLKNLTKTTQEDKSQGNVLDINTGNSNSQQEVESLAKVDSVEVLILESFPVQVEAQVSGNHPNGCVSLDQAFVDYDGLSNTFNIKITDKTEGDTCTQSLVPFQQSIDLDVSGLTAGNYGVNVNGIVASFKLDTDNSLSFGSTDPTKDDK